MAIQGLSGEMPPSAYQWTEHDYIINWEAISDAKLTLQFKQVIPSDWRNAIYLFQALGK